MADYEREEEYEEEEEEEEKKKKKQKWRAQFHLSLLLRIALTSRGLCRRLYLLPALSVRRLRASATDGVLRDESLAEPGPALPCPTPVIITRRATAPPTRTRTRTRVLCVPDTLSPPPLRARAERERR
ncbi:hypothetical protein AXG93_4542s1430 [Marchantia polymorpha subsp. ruderalis]|uniref:Uncharacterized protein n=1 Tax=Marchantia polymorpha subsp. ruderalis TaxID=1480154 RepID=A0A176W2F5_MARPO|nr:hypothetical protein AXG93_4542s1430 [Marchantia polymorpha subsp. ruderalis]